MSVIIINGHGRHFCLEEDLKGEGTREPIAEYEYKVKLKKVIFSLFYSNKVTIAVDRGHVVVVGHLYCTGEWYNVGCRRNKVYLNLF